ncbi:MAG TPA: triose-phosphate isomerase [Thermoanaerobaculia bacterium]|nr:triose-phosphate isomerase [Thermoanaerobaculia bacterium]
MRRPIFAANWKMNLRRGEAEAYAGRLHEALPALPAAEVVLFPPFPLLAVMAELLAGTPYAWGGQDLHPEDTGPHTGDVSALHLLDWQASWVLCGHSERRAEHGETDELVAAKVAQALRRGLQPLLCVGETEAERESGATEVVLERQLSAAAPTGGGAWTLAYEPVWAIGTGRTATPDLAQEAHAFLRAVTAKRLGREQAEALRVLYGGSVKPENSASLIAQPDIDGFLIGGASLDPDSFLDIIRRCASVRPSRT